MFSIGTSARFKASAQESRVNAAGTAAEGDQPDGAMHLEDAAPEATPVPGSVLGSQLLRDNLEQGFRDDAIALRDRYILDDVLDVGASCIVYKGRDPRRAAEVGKSPNVAIKALRPELRNDPGAIERLKREFRCCAALRHPNVVEVFALEELSGTWFMVMEFLDGKSLATLIYEGTPERLPVTRALGILRACSAVLSLIHERRMVHRDFNPENVWITETGDVRVIGFGASERCALPGADLDDDAERCERKLSGASTSAYASPQVLAGEPPESGDDVFSFACIAYELLGGRHPFGRWNVAELGALQLRIERPRRLPWPLWRALREGMHPSSGRRTRSAAGVLLAVERGLAEENAGRRSSVVEAMARTVADAGRWFQAQPIRAARALPLRRSFHGVWDRCVVERTGSLGEWFASRRAEIAKAAGTARRSAISFHRHGVAKIGLGLERAAAQARHLRSVLVSKQVRTMRDAQRVAGSWCETRRSVLKRMRRGREWVVGRRYVPAGAAALALACLTLVHGESTLTGTPSYAVSATGTRGPGVSAAPWADDSLRGFASERGQAIAPAFGSQDDCAIGAVGSLGRGCASASMIAASGVRSSADRAINRPAHRPLARVALERATLAVSDRAIAAVLVVTRVGSVRNPVMVRWRTVVGTAKPGEDYEGVASGTARFIDNQSVRVLYVPLKPNPNAPGDRSFAVELSRPSSGASLGQISRVVVTIQKRE
jgi:serine/threonine protein kinase